MIECPVCKHASTDTEESCDCGYDFKTAKGGKRRASTAVTIGSWTAGFGTLGFGFGFVVAYIMDVAFQNPRLHNGDNYGSILWIMVCCFLGVIVGVISGAITGAVVAQRRATLPK